MECPSGVPNDLSQNILNELKAVKCSNISDHTILNKIKIFYEGIVNNKPKFKCFANDVRREKHHIYNNLSGSCTAFLNSEFISKSFPKEKCEQDKTQVDCEGFGFIHCTRKEQEERYWIYKSQMVMQRTSLGFPLVQQTITPQNTMTLYFQRHAPLCTTNEHILFQKLLILYELKKSCMVPDNFHCDVLENYSKFDLTIQVKDAVFLLKDPTHIVILSPRTNLTQTKTNDAYYFTLLKDEEIRDITKCMALRHQSILEVIFRRFFTLLQIDNIIYKNEDIFMENCIKIVPEVGRLYGYNKSMGFVLNHSLTSCDMLVITEPNPKGKYSIFIKTITDLTSLKALHPMLPVICPYVTIQ